MSGKRLKEVLLSRGIYGLLIPSDLFGVTRMDFDWSPFAVACLGHKTVDQKDWHRVHLAVRDSLQILLDRLIERGYRRIGLAITDRPLYFDIDSVRSIFTYNRVRQPRRFIRNELVYNRNLDNFLEPVKTWIEKERPDVIVCCDHALLEACQQLDKRVPEDIGLAHLHLADDVGDWAGIDPFEKRQAAAVMDLLSAHLQRNERGLPAFAKRVQIVGEWRDGWTVHPE